MKNFLKSIPISGKLFLITIIVWTLFISIYILPIPKDSHGMPCGKDISDYKYFFVFFGLLLVIVIAIAELIIAIIKKKPKTLILIILILSEIILGYTFFESSAGSMRNIAVLARIMAETGMLRQDQNSFYNQKGRYANTQEELIESGILEEKYVNSFTNDEYTDKDGNEIEGGDDDPETWSVTTFVPTRKFGSWCRIISEGYWYTCRQDHQNWACQQE